MKVSVIIPTYNRAHILCRALDSVLDQTETDIEIIVVDDRSTDRTKQLVQCFENVRYVENKHEKGPAGARNQGIEVSSGEYIAFLDSDDEWVPMHLEKSLGYLEKFGLDACYALWYRIQDLSREKYPEDWLAIVVRELGLEVQGNVILLGKQMAEYTVTKPFWCFHNDTLVIRREALLACGLFKEYFSTAEDLEFSFRLLSGASVGLLKEYHAYYYEGYDNLVALRKEDIAKKRVHHANMVRAFKEIGLLVEASPSIVDKAKCREQLQRKIGEYEVLR